MFPNESSGGAGASTDTQSMILADLGGGSEQSAPSEPTQESAPSSTTESVDPEVADQINAIPGDEPQIEEQAAAEPQEQQPAVDDDSQKPNIPNLEQSRWQRVHAGYAWAREIGKALGVVGEDGRVDVSLFPSVEEVTGMRQAYADQLAMQHDFASSDPRNAETWVQNWNKYAPQGMTAVASQMANVLARENPHAYVAMANPVLDRFIDHIYASGAQSSDPDERAFMLNLARQVQWWATGGSNGGTYRSDDELKGLTQPDPQQQIRQELQTAKGQLESIRQKEASARTESFRRTTNDEITSAVDVEVDQSLGAVKTLFPNDAAFAAVRRDFTERWRSAMKNDTVAQRNWDIAVERAQRTQSEADRKALVNQYVNWARKTMRQLQPTYVKEVTKGFAESSTARHAQLQQSAKKVSPTSTGAPRPTSITPKLDRQPGESAREFQMRQIMADVGV